MENNYLKEELYSLIKSDSELFDFIQDGSLDGIWYWDLEHPENEWMSDKFWEIFGYDPQTKKHLASEWQDMIFKEDLEVALDNFQKHYEDPNHPYDQIVRYRHKNGSTVWVRCRGIMIRDDSGKPLRMLGAHTDITKLKQTELKLLSSEETQSFLMEKLGIGIVVHAKDLSIVSANTLAGSVLGIKKQDMLGKLITDLDWHFIDADENAISVDKYPATLVMQSKESLNDYEMGVIPKDSDQIRWLQINGFPMFDKSGEIDKIVISFYEITERKKLKKYSDELEAHLRNKQKLDSIGTLASGVAHEINNPINGALNYGQIILDNYHNDPQLREYANEIIHETKRVSEIVKNLLQFSRIEKQEHSYANIEDIINATTSLIKTIIKSEQIKLNIDIPKDLPKVKCRSQQIQQVIMNLLTNARDALNDKYPEYHENKIMKLSCEPFALEDRKWIRITVEDHGKGISENIKNRIMDPFFTTKSRDKGTGLGLSISYGIVEAHHGKLSFESEEGNYTKFYLDLPCDNGWELE